MKNRVLMVMIAVCVAFTYSEGQAEEQTGEESAVHSKPVTTGACWRFGLDRTGSHNTTGVASKKGEKWRTRIGTSIVSSPVVSEEHVYIGSDEGFYAINSEDGTVIWEYAIKTKNKDHHDGVESSACIADGFVYFTGCDGFVYALEAQTGELRWRTVPAGLNKAPLYFSPGVAYGLVFAIGRKGFSGFDVETGKEVWKSKNQKIAHAGITIDEEYLFSFSPNGNGYTIVDIKAGLFRSNGTINLAYCRSTPAILNGKLYGTSVALIGTAPSFPKIGIIDIQTKKPILANYIEPHKETKDMQASYASPTLWGGKVYVGSDSGYLYVFDDEKAEPLFNIKVDAPVRASASVSAQDGIVYFTSYDGKLHAADARTGMKKWEHTLSGPVKKRTEINSCPWVEDGVVYIGTIDGDIVAVH